jgi:anti-sigma regulatory factor (Ser/Thr protein kinase)
MVVAIYEAEVNMVAHSYGGQIVCTLEADKAIVEAIDTGPGIPILTWP